MRIKAIAGATKLEVAVATIVNHCLDLRADGGLGGIEGLYLLERAAGVYFKAQVHLFDLVNDEQA